MYLLWLHVACYIINTMLDDIFNFGICYKIIIVHVFDQLLHSCISLQNIARRSIKECTTGCHHPYGRGNLDVNISRAWGLEDKDILTGKQSDPYVVVTAVKDSSLIEVIMQTSTKKNTHDPHWNEILSFGCGYWKFIEVSVEDRDDGKDDNLLPEKKFTICEEDAPVCFEEYVTTNKGKLQFEIRYTPDGNECYPNPCYNGGTCREYSCGGYYCSCPNGYTGKRCEQKSHYNGGGGGSSGTGGNTGGGGSPAGGPQPIEVDGILPSGGDEGFN